MRPPPPVAAAASALPASLLPAYTHVVAALFRGRRPAKTAALLHLSHSCRAGADPAPRGRSLPSVSGLPAVLEAAAVQQVHNVSGLHVRGCRHAGVSRSGPPPAEGCGGTLGADSVCVASCPPACRRYPQCLEMLDLLQTPEFRAAIANPNYKVGAALCFRFPPAGRGLDPRNAQLLPCAAGAGAHAAVLQLAAPQSQPDEGGAGAAGASS